MGFAKTVWATVTGGVLLIFISWGLESIKTKLPGWAEAFIDVAWAPVAVPRAVAWITAIAIGFLVVDFYLTSRRDAEQKRRQAISDDEKEPSSVFTAPMPSPELSSDELNVLRWIVQAGSPLEFTQIVVLSDLNNLRTEHTLTSLLNRKFIKVSRFTNGTRIFRLSSEGTAFAVEHDLDKPSA